MTFKPLDLQMSVPRLQEYSGLQQQAAQRPVTEQNMLANQAQKHTEEQRIQSAAVEQSTNSGVKADQEGSQGGDPRYPNRARGQAKEDSSKETQPESPHPYKGHRVDIKW
ncbi:hypothetical protein RB620_07220 [Paenibacillus sp. LHD-117]|uniref:hypothetical protein n=1 Tax=Paenibacillus sp. LHD-117 TaxID=3071412 RepID=UPI0027E08119|nr:hypothetical protein [Paenibacillus sp. LHD-117]MDQ6419230.1 hypothetical protein [Paenibacillus sp. LHD-117]